MSSHNMMVLPEYIEGVGRIITGSDLWSFTSYVILEMISIAPSNEINIHSTLMKDKHPYIDHIQFKDNPYGSIRIKEAINNLQAMGMITLNSDMENDVYKMYGDYFNLPEYREFLESIKEDCFLLTRQGIMLCSFFEMAILHGSSREDNDSCTEIVTCNRLNILNHHFKILSNDILDWLDESKNTGIWRSSYWMFHPSGFSRRIERNNE